ncbi:hypothetical protein FQZ97_347640 [compost metagenome]
MPIDPYEKMELHTVFVENGSGVLVQPMTDEYSYVITAKHVIKINEDEDEEIRAYKESGDIEVIRNTGRIFVHERYIHPDADLAILVIDPIPNLSLKVSNAQPVRNDHVIVLGCPGTRRTPAKSEFNDYMRDIVGIVRRVKNSTSFEIESNDRPNVREVRGMSGCGVFIEINDDCYLAGIEVSLSGEIGEYHGRLMGVPITQLNSLIETNQYRGKQLAELLPPHLFCLSKSIDRTFLFRGSAIRDVSNRARGYLRFLATKSITASTPPPFKLKERLPHQAIIGNSKGQEILDEEFWSAYLEYLVVGLITNNLEEISEDFIEHLGTYRHFLYSGTESDWIDLLPEILNTEIPHLSEGSALVIGTKSRPVQADIRDIPINRIVANIDNDASSEFDISSPRKKIDSNIRLIHIEGVSRNAVISNEIRLDTLTQLEDFVQEVREKYRENF